MINNIKEYSHITLDLETLGRTPNAPIVQIAAVQFDPRDGSIIDLFKRTISHKSLKQFGFAPEFSTVYWWLTECSKEAQEMVFGGKDKDKVNIKVALMSLKKWLETKPKQIVWTHPEFDASIIRMTCDRLGMSESILYYKNIQCMRTLDRLCGIPDLKEEKKSFVAHDALEDCKFQALKISKQLNKVNAI